MILTGLPEAAGGIIVFTALANVHRTPQRDLEIAEKNLDEVLDNVERFGEYYESNDQVNVRQNFHR